MCETVKKCGCCPLNYDCDKPLTEECYECLGIPIIFFDEEEGGDAIGKRTLTE